MKKFISFEGGEGVGKTTQSNLLSKSIKSIEEECIITREPGGTKESEIIRDLIVNYKYKSFLPVGCAFFYAASMTITKYTSDKDDVNTQLFYFYLIALILCGIIYIFMGNGQFNDVNFDPTTQFIFREWFTNSEYTWKFILLFRYLNTL